MYADLLYREQPEDDQSSGGGGSADDFRFNLQSIAVATATTNTTTNTDAAAAADATSAAAPGSVTAWKADFIGQISTFEQSFATRKADFLGKLDTNSISISADSFAQALHPSNTKVAEDRSQSGSVAQNKTIQR